MDELLLELRDGAEYDGELLELLLLELRGNELLLLEDVVVDRDELLGDV